MHYYQITNPGTKDWITHNDNELAHISEYPGNIWVTENTEWASRVGATELTQAEAQTVVDNVIITAQSNWTPESGEPYPELIILPS